MKNLRRMSVSVELEPEVIMAHADMVEALAPMCTTINQEGNMLICTPEPGRLYDVVLLLFHNNVEYRLRSTPAGNAPTIL